MKDVLKTVGKGAIASALALSAVGVAYMTVKKPASAKKKLQKSTAHALDTIGDMMQNVADMLK